MEVGVSGFGLRNHHRLAAVGKSQGPELEALEAMPLRSPASCEGWYSEASKPSSVLRDGRRSQTHPHRDRGISESRRHGEHTWTGTFRSSMCFDISEAVELLHVAFPTRSSLDATPKQATRAVHHTTITLSHSIPTRRRDSAQRNGKQWLEICNSEVAATPGWTGHGQQIMPTRSSPSPKGGSEVTRILRRGGGAHCKTAPGRLRGRRGGRGLGEGFRGWKELGL